MKALVLRRTALLGSLLTLVLVAASLLGPYMYRRDPLAQNLERSLEPPSLQYPMGTDLHGRDLLSRILAGGRVSLTVAFVAFLVSALPGMILGLTAGYLGGAVDLVLSRTTDILMTLPTLLLAIAIVAVLGPGIPNLVLAIGIAGIPRFVRLIRAEVIRLRDLDFVVAARALGATDLQIIRRHIIRNTLASAIVMGSFLIASNILTEATLSFLGIGVAPPTPSWGSMIAEGQKFLYRVPWVSLFPGLFIAAVVLGVNLAGDGLRDAFDPRLRGARHS